MLVFDYLEMNILKNLNIIILIYIFKNEELNDVETFFRFDIGRILNIVTTNKALNKFHEIQIRLFITSNFKCFVTFINVHI